MDPSNLKLSDVEARFSFRHQSIKQLDCLNAAAWRLNNLDLVQVIKLPRIDMPKSVYTVDLIRLGVMKMNKGDAAGYEFVKDGCVKYRSRDDTHTN